MLRERLRETKQERTCTRRRNKEVTSLTFILVTRSAIDSARLCMVAAGSMEGCIVNRCRRDCENEGGGERIPPHTQDQDSTLGTLSVFVLLTSASGPIGCINGAKQDCLRETGRAIGVESFESCLVNHESVDEDGSGLLWVGACANDQLTTNTTESTRKTRVQKERDREKKRCRA